MKAGVCAIPSFIDASQSMNKNQADYPWDHTRFTSILRWRFSLSD